MIKKLTDETVISILKCENEWQDRISKIDREKLRQANLLGGNPIDTGITTKSVVVTTTPLAVATTGIAGIYFHVRRKGGGHNDSNWGRIGIHERDARNYAYSTENFVGDMFSFGVNECYEEIWTPAWIGTPYSYTWHTEIELEFREGFFNPPLRYPIEHAGWYGTSPKEEKMAEYRIKITINKG
jgi:hypothetical protein